MADLQDRLRRVRALFCDVDGILTDASIYVGEAGEYKRFSVRDGLGIVTWRREGYRIGWISARPSVATTIRAEELQIDFLVQQRGSKVRVIEELLATHGYVWEDVCYMGDDIVDLGPMSRAGLAVSVPNAHPEAVRRAHHVTTAPGGGGAVREVIELVLRAQGRWDRILKEHLA